VGQAGLGARVLEAIEIPPLVAELQRIGRNLRQRDGEAGFLIEDRLEAGHRAHAHVIVRAWDHKLVRLDVLVEHKLTGLRTFDPEILRRLARIEEVANLRADDVGDPVHGLMSLNLLRRRSRTIADTRVQTQFIQLAARAASWTAARKFRASLS